MKYILLLAFVLTPMVNAESWIKLNVPEGYINYIDRDSIKAKGDFTYYTMKDATGDDYYSLIKLKHDCKYNARQALSSDYYDKKTNSFIRSDVYSTSEMQQYPRSSTMLNIENMVCR